MGNLSKNAKMVRRKIRKGRERANQLYISSHSFCLCFSFPSVFLLASVSLLTAQSCAFVSGAFKIAVGV